MFLLQYHCLLEVLIRATFLTCEAIFFLFKHWHGSNSILELVSTANSSAFLKFVLDDIKEFLTAREVIISRDLEQKVTAIDL